MITQKKAKLVSIHRGMALVEYQDQSSDRFEMCAFPQGVKVGDEVLIGFEPQIKFAIPINGEDVMSFFSELNFNGYKLTFTSTSDSGRIEVQEKGNDRLHVVYKTGNKTVPLGVIATEWDKDHLFAILWYSPADAPSNIHFKYMGSEMDKASVELFYEHTTFEVISEGDTVKVVKIEER